MLTITQASTGTSTAHRNGLLRAQAEQNINQPTAGSDHIMYTGSELITPPITRNGWEWVNIAPPAGRPLTVMVSAEISHIATPIRMPIPMASSGARTSAQASLDSTMWVSETGSDFQNSTLRSRRSS